MKIGVITFEIRTRAARQVKEQMATFANEDFLLDSEFARRLYHDYAAQRPIFDYHCHFAAAAVAENTASATCTISGCGAITTNGGRCTNGVWRSGYCASDAGDREKFRRLGRHGAAHHRQPALYHWTHLELRRTFGITDTLLSPARLDEI